MSIEARANRLNQYSHDHVPPLVAQGARYRHRPTRGIVVVGASLGGIRAVSLLISSLPRDFLLPVAVVLHRHTDSDSTLTTLLQGSSLVPVVEAEDKMEITPGYDYLSPANYHLLVGTLGFSLSTEAPVLFARPSIDVLFDSAAESYQEGTIAILLTVASSDGALGTAKIKARGGFVIVQDPVSAESPQMPQSAIARSTGDNILPLSEIVPCLLGRASRDHPLLSAK
jgi:two-component system, chemotaxis family, protein-glutamate methylesterase/glutaminase